MTCLKCRHSKPYDSSRVEHYQNAIIFWEKELDEIRQEWEDYMKKPRGIFSHPKTPPYRGEGRIHIEIAHYKREIDRIKNNLSCQRYPEAVDVKREYVCGEYDETHPKSL